MTYEIKTEKGYNDWRAKSEAVLSEVESGTRILELTTSKSHGGLDAHVSVFILKKCNGFTSKETEIFGDFSKSNIAPTECKRVTEKAVLEVHNRALLEIDEFIRAAKAFYAKRDAENSEATNREEGQ